VCFEKKNKENIKLVKGFEEKINVFKSCVVKVDDVDTKIDLCLDVSSK